MDGFASVHEARCDAEAFARGDELHGNVGALPDAAGDEFAACRLRFDDAAYCVLETLLYYWVRPVELGDV